VEGRIFFLELLGYIRSHCVDNFDVGRAYLLALRCCDAYLPSVFRPYHVHSRLAPRPILDRAEDETLDIQVPPVPHAFYRAGCYLYFPRMHDLRLPLGKQHQPLLRVYFVLGSDGCWYLIHFLRLYHDEEAVTDEVQTHK